MFCNSGHSEWQSFKALHRKSGYESAEQEQYRYAIFQSNMKRAAELHKLNPEANFGMNKFSDLVRTQHACAQQHTGIDSALAVMALASGLPR